MRRLAVLFWVMLAGAGNAQGQLYLAANGDVFTAQENRHGLVLTAVPPESAPVVNDAPGLSVFAPGDVFYLGRSCDAFSRDLGNGNWQLSDAGFVVQFPSLQIAFPGQSLQLTNADKCSG